MKDTAQAYMYGTIAHDLELQYDTYGRAYAITTIIVNKNINDHIEDGKEVIEARWFKINIRKQSLIEYYKPILTKSRKVALIGEMDIIQADMYDPHAQIIITIVNSLGIVLLPSSFEKCL